jgi:phosphoglycerate dehydrogenase-like enzyme
MTGLTLSLLIVFLASTDAFLPRSCHNLSPKQGVAGKESSRRTETRTMSAATSKAVWRFQKPLTTTCRVVFAGPHFQAGLPQTQRVLATKGLLEQVELIHAPTRQELLTAVPSAHVALPFMERFDAAVFDAATANENENLRLVMQFGVGLEGVDVESATAKGVAVSNIPAQKTLNAEATAEHAVFLAMSLLRNAYDLPRRFDAKELGGLPIPRTVHGKRVTVVGYGAVGSTVARYLTALGAQVTVVRRRPWSAEDNNDDSSIQQAQSLAEALPTTDLAILACPATPETLHMVNDDTLALLPEGALLVNIGRGPLVEHGAILRALDSGRVGGFASDVGVGHPDKPSEPWDPSDPLSRHPRALFTPHVGGYSDSSYQLMSEALVRAIECVIRGEPPPIWVNKES